MSEEILYLRKLSTEIDESNKLLKALIAVVISQQERTTTDKIRLLDSAGLRPTQIAEVLGTTPNFVMVTLSRQRKSERIARAPRHKYKSKR
jgi:hypothetical protein